MRKELTEILSDKRTILTLVLMPLLLYPLLSFAFQQFFMAFIPVVEQDREYRIGVTSELEKQTVLRRLQFGAEMESWRVAGLVGVGSQQAGFTGFVGQAGYLVTGGRSQQEIRFATR